jgi:hypothetical protein
MNSGWWWWYSEHITYGTYSNI